MHLPFKGRQTATACHRTAAVGGGLQVEGGGGSLELTMLLKSDLLPKTCGCLLLGSAKFLEDAAFCPPVIIKACFPKN